MAKPTFLDFTWSITNPLVINNIKRAVKDDCFESDIFEMHGFQWYMWFRKDSNQYPGEAGVHLEMVELPQHLTNVTIIRQIIIDELNINYANTATYSRDLMNWTWPKNTLLSKDVNNFYTLTIKCKIALLHVLNTQEKEITVDCKKPIGPILLAQSPFEDQLDSLTETIIGLQCSLETIRRSLHGLEDTLYRQKPKTNQYIQMSKNMDSLSSNIKLLQKKQVPKVHLDKDQKVVKDWFEKKVKLAQYFNVFIENGFDSIGIIQLITLQQIRQMKIKKIGHQMKLLNEINQLNEKSNKLKKNKKMNTINYQNKLQTKNTFGEYETNYKFAPSQFSSSKNLKNSKYMKHLKKERLNHSNAYLNAFHSHETENTPSGEEQFSQY